MRRTESTLIALGVGMLVFIVFTGVLGWVRQYLILHTGNRIDAVLGANVGETVSYSTPAGKTLNVEILRAESRV